MILLIIAFICLGTVFFISEYRDSYEVLPSIGFGFIGGMLGVGIMFIMTTASGLCIPTTVNTWSEVQPLYSIEDNVYCRINYDSATATYTYMTETDKGNQLQISLGNNYISYTADEPYIEIFYSETKCPEWAWLVDVIRIKEEPKHELYAVLHIPEGSNYIEGDR